MSESTPTTIEFELPLGVRFRHGVHRTHARFMVGIRHPANWLQLVRFGAVGMSGYLVNLVVFAACVHLLGIDFRLASAIAFLVSVGNNFWLNRHWTFSAKQHHPGRQALKFFTVSLIAYGCSYLMLITLVDDVGVDKVVAQAIAVIAAMPLSFIGQKLWSFKA